MATIKVKKGAEHTRILGVGGYQPSRIVTNEEVLTWIDSSDEWIRTRSGIESRRWATDEETVLEMSVQDQTIEELRANFSYQQVVELMMTASFYAMVPRLIDALGVPLDPPDATLEAAQPSEETAN